jgi:hypothetical protein
MFVSFGFFVPPNLTVIAGIFVCTAAAASGLFLIVEMDTPFSGLIRVMLRPPPKVILQYAYSC